MLRRSCIDMSSSLRRKDQWRTCRAGSHSSRRTEVYAFHVLASAANTSTNASSFGVQLSPKANMSALQGTRWGS